MKNEKYKMKNEIYQSIITQLNDEEKERYDAFANPGKPISKKLTTLKSLELWKYQDGYILIYTNYDNQNSSLKFQTDNKEAVTSMYSKLETLHFENEIN